METATDALFYRDPELLEFTATVREIRPDGVVLDATAFFPGGGGQCSDRGFVGGVALKDVIREGDLIVHRLEGELAAGPGDMVNCSVDGARRRFASSAHTAEHLLAGNLLRLDPTLSVVKVSIEPPASMVVVSGQVDDAHLTEAVERVNVIISRGVDVSVEEMEIGRARALDGVRAKWERLKEGKVRIVSVGELDRSACSGVHVSNTAHIIAMAVTRVHRRGDDTTIHFLVREDAVSFLSKADIELYRASRELDTSPLEVQRVLKRRLEHERALRVCLRSLNERLACSLRPVVVGGVRFREGVFEGADPRWLTKRAREDAGTDGVGALALLNPGGGVRVILAVGEATGLDAGRMIKEVLADMGGRGGGSSSSASGGSPDWGEAEAELFIEKVKGLLENGEKG